MKTDELTKILNDWSLAAGRALLSPQTGYIHYYDKTVQEQTYHTIPLYENICFALALLRSRLMENINNAKDLIYRLLMFQDIKTGNFPLYLHEYPSCRDHAVGLRILAPLYWILKLFGHILRDDLKAKIEDSARQALQYSLKTHAEVIFPYAISVRLAAAQSAFGSLWQEECMFEEGQRTIEQLAHGQLDEWHTTTQLSEILIGLQMLYPRLENSIWHKLWEYMQYTWHYATACYAGPSIREWQAGAEPQPNLYDLYAGYFAKQFSRRATLLAPYHLQASLIQPSSEHWQNHIEPIIIERCCHQYKWKMVNSVDLAYTLIEKQGDSHLFHDQTLTTYKLIWGSTDRMHSFICQGGKSKHVSIIDHDNESQLFFNFGPEITEERVKMREIECFVDFHPEMNLTIDGKKGTLFALGQTVGIRCGHLQILISFQLVNGKGDFAGHIMRGHRPLQYGDKVEKQLQACDWILFLRTIRRQDDSTIKMTIKRINTLEDK